MSAEFPNVEVLVTTGLAAERRWVGARSEMRNGKPTTVLHFTRGARV